MIPPELRAVLAHESATSLALSGMRIGSPDKVCQSHELMLGYGRAGIGFLDTTAQRMPVLITGTDSTDLFVSILNQITDASKAIDARIVSERSDYEQTGFVHQHFSFKDGTGIDMLYRCADFIETRSTPLPTLLLIDRPDFTRGWDENHQDLIAYILTEGPKKNVIPLISTPNAYIYSLEFIELLKAIPHWDMLENTPGQIRIHGETLKAIGSL